MKRFGPSSNPTHYLEKKKHLRSIFSIGPTEYDAELERLLKDHGNDVERSTEAYFAAGGSMEMLREKQLAASAAPKMESMAREEDSATSSGAKRPRPELDPAVPMNPFVRSDLAGEVHAVNTANKLLVDSLMSRFNTLVVNLPQEVKLHTSPWHLSQTDPKPIQNRSSPSLVSPRLRDIRLQRCASTMSVSSFDLLRKLPKA